MITISPVAHAGEIDLSSLHLDPSIDVESRSVIEERIDAAEKLLPPAFFSQIKAPIKISLNINQKTVARATDRGIELGKTFVELSRKNSLSLSLKDPRVSVILFGESGAVPQTHHATVQQFLTATILHELAHVYDRNAKPLSDEKEKRSWCESLDLDSLSVHSECRDYLNKHYAFSDSAEFENIDHHFQVSDPALRERRNIMDERSPDPYEWKNPQEAFAVNFEYFILDLEFKCRRPFHFEYFQKVFNYDPAPALKCDNVQDVVSNDLTALSNSLIRLDPSRLYAVDYLLAGPASSIMSRFGHAMLRFVFCAEGQPMGPQCYKNLQTNFVLGFSALLDSYRVDSLKGLNGTYDSLALFYNISQVITQYSNQEFRDLYSYPLKLTQEEKIRVLRAAIYDHWTYRGKYYFLSGNCATDALDLLKFALPGRFELQAVMAQLPTQLRDELVRARLVGSGEVFPSKKSYYERAARMIASVVPLFDSLDSFEKLSMDEKSRVVDRVKSRGDLKELASLYLILSHDFALRREALFAKLMNDLENGKADAKTLEQFRSEKGELFAKIRSYASPASLIESDSYGLPNSDEIESIRNGPFWEQAKRAINGSVSFQDALMSAHREEALELNQLSAMKAALSEAIKEAH